MDHDIHTPPHIINIFLPLVNLTMAHGPTEYWPGSHIKGANKNKKPTTYDNTLPSVSFTGEVGDAIAFDYRVVHRGTPNFSDEMRPMFYFTCARPWVADDSNFPEESLGIDRSGGKA